MYAAGKNRRFSGLEQAVGRTAAQAEPFGSQKYQIERCIFGRTFFVEDARVYEDKVAGMQLKRGVVENRRPGSFDDIENLKKIMGMLYIKPMGIVGHCSRIEKPGTELRFWGCFGIEIIVYIRHRLPPNCRNSSRFF